MGGRLNLPKNLSITLYTISLWYFFNLSESAKVNSVNEENIPRVFTQLLINWKGIKYPRDTWTYSEGFYLINAI